MKIIDAKKLESDKIVKCPNNGFVSHRLLLEKDGMGYSMTKTVLEPTGPHRWHYKNHLESCYCVSGNATVTNENTGESYQIFADVTYVLDNKEPHIFEAYETTVLICVFNPPLLGDELHGQDDSYPAKHFSPVYQVKSVPIDKVTANDYNPNKVAPPEMELLETSIWEDGYTQPVVTVYDRDKDEYVVVDGFHRYLVLRDSERIRKRERGLLPVVVLNKEMHDRMASTIRHNRARGSHNVELMSQIVAELVEMGKGDRWICKHIGMSKDELLRLKQITGVAALFQNEDFSQSWEASFDEQDLSSLDEMGRSEA